ncbi:MAG: HlyC/CorC family transporter [Phycisphaerales bacterium]|nr:HlyC/CorC family transporter [Phycisphaerales bacterium]
MKSEAWFWIALASTVISGVCSTLFHALREVARSRLEQVARDRNNKALLRRVDAILDDMDGHANAMALPRIVANLVLAPALVFHSWHSRGGEQLDWADVSIGLGAAAAVVWVFGLAIPTGIARHAAAETICLWSTLVRAGYILATPFNVVVRFFDEVVRRLADRPATAPEQQAHAELMSVVDEARQEGQFDRVESDMIEAVVKFRDMTVAQIMTPRTEMEAMALTNSLGEVTATLRRSNHSRLPVYDGTLDRIVGVFYVKDLMRWMAGEAQRMGKTFDFKAILRPAIFVPETKTIRELLTELLQNKVHLVMVADEYGGTAGLVTIEDIVEQIVGEIKDEYELPEDDKPEVVIAEDKRSATIDARAYIVDANEGLRDLGVELPASEDYDTVGGFVTVTLGRIPPRGERFEHDGAVVTVLAAEPTRVTLVRVEPKPSGDSGDEGRRSDEGIGAGDIKVRARGSEEAASS